MKFSSLSAQQALLILNGLPQIGPITQKHLLEAFGGDPLNILQADAKELMRVPGVGREIASLILQWSRHFNLKKEEAVIKKNNAAFISHLDDDYPPLLKQIYDPPIGLYALGPARPKLKSIAIIGSRRTSLYGQKLARKLSSDLARMGFCVVSGMARGIDTAAHEGALESGGQTVAVLGTGADIVYPPENRDLYQDIIKTGAVYSEFSFGTRPSKTTFPMRNRIIAGMTQGVIVVETDNRGGSMITARFAAEYDRRLFAVPGRVDQDSSRGCNQLIREGAVLCRGVEDILEELLYREEQAELDLEEPEKRSPRKGWADGLNVDEKAVMETLVDGTAQPPDTIVEMTGMSYPSVSSTLLMLELKNRIGKRYDGTYEVREEPADYDYE